MTKRKLEEPILYEPPVVTIAGTEYHLRRLGLRDVFAVSRILGRGVSLMASVTDFTPAQVLQVLVASLTANEDEVLALIASILGVDRKRLDDPSIFPMLSIVTILEALAQHQDLVEFLGNVNTLATRLPEMQMRSGASSPS